MPESMASSEYSSVVAPYIGAVFEGSRIVRKVTDIRTGIPEVPVYNVEKPDHRQLWAFRNIEPVTPGRLGVSSTKFTVSKAELLSINFIEGLLHLEGWESL